MMRVSAAATIMVAIQTEIAQLMEVLLTGMVSLEERLAACVVGDGMNQAQHQQELSAQCDLRNANY